MLSEVNREGLLQLVFADTADPDRSDSCTVSQATELLDFVEQVWDRVEVLLIHCEVGMSRSPGVAAALSRIYYGDDGPWGEYDFPNSLVKTASSPNLTRIRMPPSEIRNEVDTRRTTAASEAPPWYPPASFSLALGIALAVGGCGSSDQAARVRIEMAEPEPLSFEQQVSGVREGRLDVIAVQNQTIRDRDLAHLADLTDLLVLTLDDTQVTDAGLKHLSCLENLEHLRLRGAAITDAGIQHLLSLPSLTILNLPQAQFTDAGLAQLKTLPNLEQLRFSSPHVTDAGMAELADFPVLWHLHLIQVPITDRGLLPLERMAQLLSLYMDGMQVSDDGLRRLIDQRQRLDLTPLHLHIDQLHRDFDPMKGTHEH